MSNLLKNLLIALGISILLFVVYVVFIRDASNSDNGDLVQTSSPLTVEAEMEIQQLLVVTNQINALHVDGSIFKNPIFSSLRDYRINIGSGPSGRGNPFLGF